LLDKLQKSKVRLNLDLSPKVKDQLSELQTRTDAASLVEVIRRALAVYDMLLDHEATNGKIILENADGTRERVRLI
jgi:hypothetical protein